MYKASDICLLNVQLYLPDKDEVEVEAADLKQRKEETAKRARGESSDHASVIARQTEGPIQRFLIPLGHSRQSRFRHFKMSLKCRVTAREASFGVIRQLLVGGAGDEDDLPLDVIASIRRRVAGCSRS